MLAADAGRSSGHSYPQYRARLPEAAGPLRRDQGTSEVAQEDTTIRDCIFIFTLILNWLGQAFQ